MADEKENKVPKRVFQFQDKKTDPDGMKEYTHTIQSEHTPLLIDNGSFHCRVGWLSNDKPQMVFRNVVAKSRGKKDGDIELLVGNDIPNIELVRWSLKNQFDRDVVTHFDAQEQIFDHIFSRHGVNTQGCVNHPVVMTECVCNPNYSRQSMNELLFECYHVPQVTYGIDSLFSLYRNQRLGGKSCALIVSSGYQTSHILPVVNGALDARKCKRINLGGSSCISYMQRLLQLRYPNHAAQITLSRAQEIVHEHTYLAPDYSGELCNWQKDDATKNEIIIQLPFVQPAGGQNGGVKDEEKERLRREKQGRKLQEINCKKQQEKLVEEEKKLKQLLKIGKQESDSDKFAKALAKEGFKTAEEFHNAVENLAGVVKKRSDKVKKLQASLVESKNKESSSMREAKKSAEEKKAEQPTKNVMTPEMLEWLDALRSRRQNILDTRQQRQQRKDELSNRRSAASVQRMRMISKLAHDPNIRDDGSLRGGHKKPKEDTFGMNDDDWMVYRHISKDAGDSDSEKEQEELGEIENVLKKHDPNFQTEEKPQVLDLESYYQLNIGIERVRVPEVLFQPSMLGVDQAGLAETIEFVLKKYTPEIQNKLVQNVFVTGGNTHYPNFCARLERELLAMRPFQSKFKVYNAENLALDAWLGMRDWVRDIQDLRQVSTTRQQYEEMGGEYLKEHSLSNLYVPTPVI